MSHFTQPIWHLLYYSDSQFGIFYTGKDMVPFTLTYTWFLLPWQPIGTFYPGTHTYSFYPPNGKLYLGTHVSFIKKKEKKERIRITLFDVEFKTINTSWKLFFPDIKPLGKYYPDLHMVSFSLTANWYLSPWYTCTCTHTHTHNRFYPDI